MAQHLRRVFLPILCWLFFATNLFSQPVKAQSTGQVFAYPVETASFPSITTYVSVFDPSGKFLYDLAPRNLSVHEDGKSLPVRELKLMRPGAQLVVAINPDRSFILRDSQGLTRYDHLAQALRDWAKSKKGSNLDDLSLLASNGFERTHLSDIDRWLKVLGEYQPAAGDSSAGFDVLGRSMETAVDPGIRPGMGRAILFITSLPAENAEIALQSLTARANQRGVRVFVWLVASAELFTSGSAMELKNLAEQTGGSFFAFSGYEDIPQIEDYLEPLRSTYSLAYNSKITNGDVHTLSIDFHNKELEGTSQEQEFALEVLPPNIAFISPPQEVKRSGTGEESQLPASLVPDSQALDVLIEFPDGHDRQIKKTTLYVDEHVVDQNTSKPFDHFAWGLKDYRATGEHHLKAEITDSLGLSNTSMEATVLVKVEQPATKTRLVTVVQNRGLLASLVVLVSGAILFLVLVLGGRIAPSSLRYMRTQRRRSDPVTQPVRTGMEGSLRSGSRWLKSLRWPKRKISPPIYAYLIPLSDTGEPDGRAPIAVTQEEVSFGADPMQASQVIEDTSVAPLHARLLKKEGGVFRLFDEGATAGTWINYSPISKEGARLEHGDLIHIGRSGFRFLMRDPKRVRRPVILPEEK
jgi:hypothetical protein